MGTCSSKNTRDVYVTGSDDVDDERSAKVQWKVLPSSGEYRKKFEEDGTLNKHSNQGHLEFRTMLEEPVAQRAMGTYAAQIQATEMFMCWVDIQEYKDIKSDSYRRSKALHVYHKYVKEDAVLFVGELEVSDRVKYKDDLDKSEGDPGVLTPSFYEKLQTRCFNAMFHHIYIPFKNTDEYSKLVTHLKKKYNNVRLSDFEYYGKLGEGGFGFVVHCMKKSTGKHYAMKVQTKRGLLDCFADDPWRADFEKQAFASCQHPFIVNLDYAFQTDSLAIMVLGLSTAGDLNKALVRSPEERLCEDRVRFYAAEIVLAISYLHQMGLMYRDLKPNNVLLNEDGHIQLVDLGGVADGGGTLGVYNEAHGLVPLFAQKFGQLKTIAEDDSSVAGTSSKQAGSSKSADNSKFSSAAHDGSFRPPPMQRKLSIMGTFGYMAPEMVVMLSQQNYEKTGYSFGVDWWSLGVTMFKLLTGFRPFTDDNFNTFVDMCTTMNELVRDHCDSTEYAKLFQEIPFPPYLSVDCMDLISKLLDVDERTRLGCGPNGAKEIKAHKFFDGIDWSLLEQKHVEAPFKPDKSKVIGCEDAPPFPDFETMMKEYNKEKWLTQTPAEKEQRYFANW